MDLTNSFKIMTDSGVCDTYNTLDHIVQTGQITYAERAVIQEVMAKLNEEMTLRLKLGIQSTLTSGVAITNLTGPAVSATPNWPVLAFGKPTSMQMTPAAPVEYMHSVDPYWCKHEWVHSGGKLLFCKLCNSDGEYDDQGKPQVVRK